MKRCPSIFVFMPLSIPNMRAAAACPSLAKLVAAGGATLVQLRDKMSDTRAMVETARALKAALTPFGVPLLINDRVDVALAAGADGVHVGQTDMAPDDARRLLGPKAIIGLSINTDALAEAAPIETAGLCRHRRRLCDDVEGPEEGADRRRGLAPDRRRVPQARSEISRLRHRRHQCGERRRDHCGRRRRRVGDLGAVARRDPTAAAKSMRAVVDDALAARKQS